MAKLTLHLPDEKHERLRQLAAQHQLSMNKLLEEMATVVLAEFDAETRFRARAEVREFPDLRKALAEFDTGLGE